MSTVNGLYHPPKHLPVVVADMHAIFLRVLVHVLFRTCALHTMSPCTLHATSPLIDDLEERNGRFLLGDYELMILGSNGHACG